MSVKITITGTYSTAEQALCTICPLGKACTVTGSETLCLVSFLNIGILFIVHMIHSPHIHHVV